MRQFSDPVVLLDHLPLSQTVTPQGFAVLEAELASVGLRITGVDKGCVRLAFSETVECNYGSAGRIESVLSAMSPLFAAGSTLIYGFRDATCDESGEVVVDGFDRFDVIKIWIDSQRKVRSRIQGYPMSRRARLISSYRKAAKSTFL